MRSAFVTPQSSRLIEYKRGSASTIDASRAVAGWRSSGWRMTASNSAFVIVPAVSSDQRARASRTARISAASVAASAASAATARAARCGWPVRSKRRRSARGGSRGAAARP